MLKLRSKSTKTESTESTEYATLPATYVLAWVEQSPGCGAPTTPGGDAHVAAQFEKLDSNKVRRKAFNTTTA